MKAILVREFGDPSAVEVSELDDREPGAHEVKVRVHGVGIGYFDALLVKGEYQMKPPLPFVPGSSLSGVVDSVGAKVEGLAPGDHVAGFNLMGGLAEFAWLHKGSVFRLPPSIPLDDAANFFIAYATAVLGLAELAAIKQGETVLILGAAGTTGSTAIEVSKALGAKVVACASTEEKRAHCLSLGADAVIDYTQPDWRRATSWPTSAAIIASSRPRPSSVSSALPTFTTQRLERAISARVVIASFMVRAGTPPRHRNHPQPAACCRALRPRPAPSPRTSRPRCPRPCS